MNECLLLSFVIQKCSHNSLSLKKLNYFMKKDSLDYKFCINLAIDNAKKRIKSLEKGDQKCILEEYKEWLKESIDYQSILLLREDPII